MRKLLIVVFCCVLFVPNLLAQGLPMMAPGAFPVGGGAANCGSGYAHYKTITVNSGQVTGTLTGFAITFMGDSALKTTGNGGYVQSSSGYDVIFCTASSGGTQIPMDFVTNTYSASTGTGEWVLTPASTAVGTVVYVFFGKSGVTTDQSARASVCATASLVSMWHFPNGTTLDVTDSCGANNGATTSGYPQHYNVTAATGKLDGGIGYVYTSSSSQTFGTSSTLAPAALTASAWVKATAFSALYGSVFSRDDATDYSYTLLVKSNGKLAVYAETPDAAHQTSYDGTGSNTLSTGTWYHLAMTYAASGSLIGYVNGSQDGSAAAPASAVNNSSGFTMYVGNSGYSNRSWSGTIDEARIASVVRSSAWLTAEYNNQNAPASFYTVGALN